MESLGDWSWPGTGGGAAAEVLPPPWVPVFPPRLEPVVVGEAGWQDRRQRPRRMALGALLGGLAAISVAVAVKGPVAIEQLVGYDRATTPPPAELASAAATTPPAPPALRFLSSDAAGSSIDRASYHSPALGTSGSFLVYLPAGYATSAARYPVLYLLHGNNQPNSAFLQVGLQRTLDRLTAAHVVPPMVAVMIQGGPGANNWRGHYESYVLEVQELVDRMLATEPARGARAIAGDSMGGYGAMNIALGNPYRFAVVESWLGFFNGLEGELRAGRAILGRLGLHAFVYGAEADRIADPAEDPPFAASLRAAGANAQSAVYPGEHSLHTVEAHLADMLAFAGRALARPAIAAAPQAADVTR